MLDIVTKAMSANIAAIFKDYFTVKIVHNPSGNIVEDFQRNYTINETQNIKFLENIDGMTLMSYTRTPLRQSEIGRNRNVGKQWTISESDNRKAQIKEHFLARYTINYKFCSNIRECVEIFEMFYEMKMKAGPDLTVTFKLEDTKDQIQFVYNTTFNDLSMSEEYTDDKGPLWVVDFSVDLDGLVFTPESSYWPRLLRIKLNYLVSDRDGNLWDLDNYLTTKQTDYNMNLDGEIISITKSTVDDSSLIATRFNLN